ncbi:hypothetical protein Tco_0580093 [Tanacetum coccineum]
MSQDQSIPRRNKVDWHVANDDPILTTMRFIPQHEVVQKLLQPAVLLIEHEGTGVTPWVPDVPIYGYDEEQISWKSSDEEDDDDEANIGKDEDDNDQDDDERTESDNDGDDFVHPKLSTHDDEARKDDEVNEEESNDESNEESNEESDEEVQ